MSSVRLQNIERKIQLLESKVDSKRISAGSGLLVSDDGINTLIKLDEQSTQAIYYHPWRILIKALEDDEYEYSVYGGTINGVLPSNWDNFYSSSEDEETWVFWRAKLNGNEITDLTIETNSEPPDIKTAYSKNVLPDKVERLIGVIQGNNILYQFAKSNYYIEPKKMLEVHEPEGTDIYYSTILVPE